MCQVFQLTFRTTVVGFLTIADSSPSVDPCLCKCHHGHYSDNDGHLWARVTYGYHTDKAKISGHSISRETGIVKEFGREGACMCR
ncbi:MAG: hypothetical protein HQL06_09050 [Nitrospirae bacterium]|nr:hypothetical protein [Nitrospirota bacterium]